MTNNLATQILREVSISFKKQRKHEDTVITSSQRAFETPKSIQQLPKSFRNPPTTTSASIPANCTSPFPPVPTKALLSTTDAPKLPSFPKIPPESGNFRSESRNLRTCVRAEELRSPTREKVMTSGPGLYPCELRVRCVQNRTTATVIL